MQDERKSYQKADEEEGDTLTESWCHLAQYLSSKGTGLFNFNSFNRFSTKCCTMIFVIMTNTQQFNKFSTKLSTSKSY